ncbi:DNA alkylation repair protein [Kiloniella litopenaei]|uniref:DNA alkylation repair protein n=1 Tax=Kiloniella litopenaei TaxID=1549748 RepID=A0A0M2R7V7_9PROT|nr:DNA alkylation repair protein [Kiloniella litopenaei]KKJ77736.1 DNA alkylation repair protein [Kiloniella litopenaei]
MEPFKEVFNHKSISKMAEHISARQDNFDQDGFIAYATKDLSTLELKQRSERITEALYKFLPDDFCRAAEILQAILHPDENISISDQGTSDKGVSGWLVMPMCDYVAFFGKDHFHMSMELLKEMTKRSSSEFAIRHFFLSAPKETMATVLKWADDENYHVRRLASEGSRPRLPWSMQLPDFINDPAPLVPLLEKLRDDPEEYVRRSVANSLNDIAKDHPDLVADIAKKWMKGASKERQKLIRHACRTLIKSGHKKCLEALGYKDAQIELTDFNILTPSVTYGEGVEFEVTMNSVGKVDQALILDFVIHHRKANGDTSPKVFKWKTFSLAVGEEHTIRKRHNIKPITTRKYYPGIHRVEIIVNGTSFGIKDFELIMEVACA